MDAILKRKAIQSCSSLLRSSKESSFTPRTKVNCWLLYTPYAKWKHFIGTRLVTIETDHASLVRMLVQKKVTTRLGEWLDKLAEHNIQVVYKPGRQNSSADALNRRPDHFQSTLLIADTSPHLYQRERSTHLQQRLVNREEAYSHCSDFRDIARKGSQVSEWSYHNQGVPLPEDGKENFKWEGNLL